MKTLKFLVAVLFATACTLPVLAQQHRVSPHETVSQVIDGNRVTITYGRPYTKDPHSGAARKIWGGLVPYGKVWRTGADEATLLITQKPIVLGGVTVPAGSYTLYSLPAEDGTAKLIINKQLGQWGTQYDESQDLARVDLTKVALDAPMDQLTISIGKNQGGGGLLKIGWESTQYTIAFTVAK